MDLKTALINLENITGFKPIKSGNSIYLAVCPCHDDSNPSLAVTKGKMYPVAINCFVGCSFKDVISTIEKNVPQISKKRKRYDYIPFWEKEIVAVYNYQDSKYRNVFQKVRFEPKGFAIRHWTRGQLKWGLGNNKPILYNLPNVINNKTIFILEGEKNVNAISKWGFAGTCNFDGAGKWLDEYNKNLFGKLVYIIPDNDVAGLEHANLLVNSVGKVARVKIIELPGLSYKQDFYDWVQLGFTKEEFERLL